MTMLYFAPVTVGDANISGKYRSLVAGGSKRISMANEGLGLSIGKNTVKTEEGMSVRTLGNQYDCGAMKNR